MRSEKGDLSQNCFLYFARTFCQIAGVKTICIFFLSSNFAGTPTSFGKALESCMAIKTENLNDVVNDISYSLIRTAIATGKHADVLCNSVYIYFSR